MKRIIRNIELTASTVALILGLTACSPTEDSTESTPNNSADSFVSLTDQLESLEYFVPLKEIDVMPSRFNPNGFEGRLSELNLWYGNQLSVRARFNTVTGELRGYDIKPKRRNPADGNLEIYLRFTTTGNETVRNFELGIPINE
ncbi:MAG: hypothetical protein ABH849_03150 [Nanoarchaeota archaeon]